MAQLPLEVFEKHNKNSGKKPLAIFDKPLAPVKNPKQKNSTKHANHISHCNVLAEQQHVEIGMNQTLAKSLCPELQLTERNIQLEQQALQQLAICAYNFSPDIYFLDKEESLLYGNKLFIEISRSLRLFKGLKNFLEKFLEEIKHFGFYFQFSLAENPTLASMASRHGCSIKPVQLESFFRHSIEALEINGNLVEKLHSTGIRKIGDLLKIDSALIGKQFGKQALDYLHELKGEKQKRLSLFILPDEFSDEIFFISEVENSHHLIHPIEKSLEHLCQYLQIGQLSIQSIKLQLYSRACQHGAPPVEMNISFSQPEHRFEYMQELLHLKFENLSIEDAVIKIVLQACDLQERQIQEKDLFKQSLKSCKQTEIDHHLLNSIYTRLGDDSVFRLSIKDEHRPEKGFSRYFNQQFSNQLSNQCQLQNKNKALKKALEHESISKIRPLWFLNQARKLKHKNDQVFYFGKLKLLSDAERIETGWWDKQAVKRDYFIAQHPKGEFYWIYRDYMEQGQWFLHGIFS